MNGTDTATCADSLDQRLNGFMASVERQAWLMARQSTGHREDAHDIVQDVMLAFVRRYRHKPPSQWRPLFFRAVQNRIRDHHRHHGVRQRWLVPTGRGQDQAQSDPANYSPCQQTAHPAHQAASDALGEAIEQALEQLPERQRQAFVLRQLEQCSVAETAQSMRCSEGSVKTHLSRAMAALRQHLGEWTHDGSG